MTLVRIDLKGFSSFTAIFSNSTSILVHSKRNLITLSMLSKNIAPHGYYQVVMVGKNHNIWHDSGCQ